MSPIVTQIETLAAPSIGYTMTWNEATVQDDVLESKEHGGILSVYTMFLSVMVILALFFAASLAMTLTMQYFLDLGSAIMGLLGSTGLALVGWFSKRQIRS